MEVRKLSWEGDDSAARSKQIDNKYQSKQDQIVKLLFVKISLLKIPEQFSQNENAIKLDTALTLARVTDS